jgi:hypothetical protein
MSVSEINKTTLVRISFCCALHRQVGMDLSLDAQPLIPQVALAGERCLGLSVDQVGFSAINVVRLQSATADRLGYKLRVLYMKVSCCHANPDVAIGRSKGHRPFKLLVPREQY